MTCGPRIASSPTSPWGRSFEGSSASTIFASVPGNGMPIPSFTTPVSGFACVTGEASVSPYPSTILPPVTFSNSWRTSFGRGAAPETHAGNAREDGRLRLVDELQDVIDLPRVRVEHVLRPQHDSRQEDRRQARRGTKG